MINLDEDNYTPENLTRVVAAYMKILAKHDVKILQDRLNFTGNGKTRRFVSAEDLEDSLKVVMSPREAYFLVIEAIRRIRDRASDS